MPRVILLCAFVALLLSFANADLGGTLLRTYFVWAPIPLTASAAQSAGWTQDGGCETNLGIAYQASGGLQKDSPLMIYYTAAGQIAGIAMSMWSAPPGNLTDYWLDQNDGTYRISISFRTPDIMCSGATSGSPVGDVVVINQQGQSVSIPLTDSQAAAENWTNGSCITKMGRHWSYWNDSAPYFSGQVDQLFPVMPMYFNGQITTFLINSPVLQRMEPLGIWEGPFPNLLFCKNFCGPCSFNGTSFWSTIHFWFEDPSTLSCPSSC